MWRRILIVVGLPVFLAGCGLQQLHPVTHELRSVTRPAVRGKSITVSEGMVWYDSPRRDRGIRFPPGRYELEAEDDDYWYFRSPEPLEFRDFDNGQMVSARNIPGGLMVAKGFNTLPGGGYIDGDGGTKTLVWKLGRSFLRFEGAVWKKNF